MDLNATLTSLAREPAQEVDIAELALGLARDEFPSLDVEGYLAEIAAMAAEARRTMHGHLSLQVQGLTRYLFHELGFRGNARDYYDPRNSYFNVVLDRRLGIPITLCAVAMAVGARAGLRIEGVGLPGHFIVKAIDGPREVLFDPFNGGRILSWDDCEEISTRASGVRFEANPDSLRSVPMGWIVRRWLNNQRRIYLNANDWRRTLRVSRRLTTLAPEDVSVYRDIGLCWLKLDQPGRAIDPLRHYLAVADEADDRPQVKTFLQEAVRRIAQWN